MAAEQLTLYELWETTITILPNGRFTGEARRPVKVSPMLTTKEVMKRTGLQKSQAVVVMHQLGAEQRRKGCRVRVQSDALEAHLSSRAGGNN